MPGILMSRNTRSGVSRSTSARPSGAGRAPARTRSPRTRGSSASSRGWPPRRRSPGCVRSYRWATSATATGCRGPGGRVVDQAPKLGLVDDRHAQGARLLELAAGVVAGDERRRLLADRAGHLGAQRLEPLGPRRGSCVAGRPVRTKVCPASGPGSRPPAPGCPCRRPAAPSRSTSAAFRGHRRTAAPTRRRPADVRHRLELLDAGASPAPPSSRRPRPAPGRPRSPTWRMPRA